MTEKAQSAVAFEVKLVSCGMTVWLRKRLCFREWMVRSRV